MHERECRVDVIDECLPHGTRICCSSTDSRSIERKRVAKFLCFIVKEGKNCEDAKSETDPDIFILERFETFGDEQMDDEDKS